MKKPRKPRKPRANDKLSSDVIRGQWFGCDIRIGNSYFLLKEAIRLRDWLDKAISYLSSKEGK